MNHVFNVKTWEECEARISEIVAIHALFDDTPLVFRGQADADWRLATTLERRVPTGCYVDDYFRLIMRIKPEVETYSSRRWDDVNFKEISDWSMSYDDFSRGLLLSYEYLAYLRHHGFPSPLLDWSRSPYVAAYFAFANAYKNDVALYVYYNDPRKVGSGDVPAIHLRGNYVRAPRRHFRQQSCYTTCTLFDPAKGWSFVPHNLMLEAENTDQMVLWKIILPATLRKDILTMLDRFTLNAFSLFEDDNSLMETLAFREVDLKSPASPLVPDFFKDAWARFQARSDAVDRAVFDRGG